ncbi:hypothetical protein ACFV3E_24520 [Streptomyces sp. NPDC059718]
MTLAITEILDKAVSHAASGGWFDTVNSYEQLENAPGHDLTAAVWVDDIAPIRGSGLDSTSVRLALYVRIYTSNDQLPRDVIDPHMVSATDDLIRAYVGDFTLDGLVRQVDVRGIYGPGLQARAGYLNLSGAVSRVMTITLPLIVNDLWDEEE